MANKRLFGTNAALLAPPADALNEAGGRAYALPPRHALAQYAATGCLNATFYASAEQQLATLLALCEQVTPEFIAKTAVYCRERGLMKDVPALLCAVLAVRDVRLLAQVFPRVIDDARMLRNFVQIVRSGQVGRRSLGTAPKRLVREWLAARTEEQLFRAAVGQNPSLADIVKMVHPRPATPAREALYAYLIGKAGAEAMVLLPETVQQFEAFKAARANGDDAGEPPDVPFQMLTALNLSTADWTAIARRATWQQTGLNLNTFARHGVFAVEGMAGLVAAKLSDEQAIVRARVFPYQLLAAYQAAGPEIPVIVRQALHTAMEVATRNVPALPGKIYVLLDVSGSMHSPVTGWRKGATTKLRCIDVAALIAAAILRTNPQAEVIAFHDRAIEVALHAELPVMANAERLAALPSGGTNCSAPLALLNGRKAEAGLVIFVSDMESWMDRWGRGYGAVAGNAGTGTMHEWQVLKARNPRARLVCIDLQAYGTTQAQEREDVLNVGGFSDQAFELLGLFARGELTPEHWVGAIDAVRL